MIYSPFKFRHTDRNKIALHTRVNCQHRPGNDENSGGSGRVSAAGLFVKKEPNLGFLKIERITCHCLFKHRPHQARILSGYSQEKVWAPHLYCVWSETWKRWNTQAEAGRPLTTLERNRWRRRNNNCAVARTRTVEVLKRLIGDATEGAGPNHG